LRAEAADRFVKIVRSVPRRVALLVLVGLVVASAAAVIALAHGGAKSSATPIGSGVVVIDTNLAFQGAAAAGTGMVLTSSGEVLTNNHVISGATTIHVVFPKSGHTYKARVLGYDRTADVALLHLQGASGLRTVSIGSTKLSVGTTVTARGNAGGDGSITSAPGTVIGLGKSITASDDSGGSEHLTGLIETDAGVRPGDSGGPLVNTQGQVVGMDTAASAQFVVQDSSATDAYAIPIAKALTIAHSISSGQRSATVHIGATAFLGIEAERVDAPGFGYGGQVASGSGALIAGVVSRGPAASAGLVAGDVITAINGHVVSSPTAITAFVVSERPGAKISVAYVDLSGASHTASVTLGSGPAQ